MCKCHRAFNGYRVLRGPFVGSVKYCIVECQYVIRAVQPLYSFVNWV